MGYVVRHDHNPARQFADPKLDPLAIDADHIGAADRQHPLDNRPQIGAPSLPQIGDYHHRLVDEVL